MSLENVFAIGKKHKVGNMEVEIKQVALGDLPLLTEVASKFMGSKGKSTKENIMSLIQKDFHLVKDVFSVMTDINQEYVSKLNLNGENNPNSTLQSLDIYLLSPKP